ncbi:YheC/YheD family protein [Paenibacillus sp. MMO-177]|uniref:YheC/YheD family protein n=1 Tax=Paenibacillus sp. MMO-177 TaxID=3081289 RepID=UPI003015B69F
MFNTSIYDKVCLSQDLFNQLYSPDTADRITRSIHDLSLRCAEIMDENNTYHLGEFSVDFALDNKERAWIIELNGKPQKTLYNSIGKQSAVYMRPMQYAHYLCKHGS